ncbi:MAG: glycosyltransferase [Coriobacteriia bacterium]|nr:glycosyltransferase [Coriobacteriia bacterium]
MTNHRYSVLLVTYEFPPTGGAGVQRLAKFARYLPTYGWDPVVLAAEHVPGRAEDYSLADEVAGVRVVRTPARPVNAWISAVLAFLRQIHHGSRRLGSSGGTSDSSSLRQAKVVAATGRGGRTERLTRFFTMPDFAFLWIRPAVRAGVRLGRSADVDVVFASGPPFSVLIAGKRIAHALEVPFVADFRDAWRDNPGNSWYPTAWHRRRSHSLERDVLTAAAAVTTAHPLETEIAEMGGPVPRLIPNGFDRADLLEWTPAGSGPLLVTFMGTFYIVNGPLPVFQALKAIREGRHGRPRDIRLRVVGSWPKYVEDLVSELGLEEAIELISYVPHKDALGLLATSDVGLVVYADLPTLRASTPAKLYEYLGIGLPILFVGPEEGQASDLLRNAEAGLVVSYSDVGAISAALVDLADRKESGVLGSAARRDVIDAYDRRVQAGTLARVFDGLVSSPTREDADG